MIDSAIVALLWHDLCTAAGLGAPTREPIRVWRLSGVERLRLASGETVVFKYATGPFTREHEVLERAASRGVPVPALYAASVRPRVLGMLLEDLGTAIRDADDAEASNAAVRLHAAGMSQHLDTFDEVRLRALPGRALAHLQDLQAVGRFTAADDIAHTLRDLDQVSADRAAGADLQPFGLCHGEFHPTSLHLSATGWRLLDLAKAFNGPGLLDLATWQGTRNPADPTRLRRMLTHYVAAGGHPDALASRGGLPAEIWALGWHRVWAAAWLIEQAANGVDDPSTDASNLAVLRRQLIEAARLLASTSGRQH